jgi:hypothetical protein
LSNTLSLLISVGSYLQPEGWLSPVAPQETMVGQGQSSHDTGTVSLMSHHLFLATAGDIALGFASIPIIGQSRIFEFPFAD